MLTKEVLQQTRLSVALPLQLPKLSKALMPAASFRHPLPTVCSKAVEAQTALWHQAFLGELADAKRAFEGLKAELPPGAALPPYSGRILMLRGLLHSVERTWDHLQALAGGGCLPAVPKAAESAAAYEALHMGMQQYANTLHMEASWL